MDLLMRLRDHMLGNDPEWQSAKEKGFIHNRWFIPPFIELAAQNIAGMLLNEIQLQQWIDKYRFASIQTASRTIGVVMPGNIPLAGFYHFLCIFLAGFRQRIK